MLAQQQQHQNGREKTHFLSMTKRGHTDRICILQKTKENKQNNQQCQLRMKGSLPVHKYQARIPSRFSTEKAVLFSALNNEVNAAAARPTVTSAAEEEIDNN